MSTTIKLNQNPSLLEIGISRNVVTMIYNLIKKYEEGDVNGINMNDSNIVGQIRIKNGTCKEYIDKINEYFDSFIINTPKYYIFFKDSLVEQILLNANYGDGIGITKDDSSAISGTLSASLFMNNTSITSFDELKYFNWAVASWAYHSTGGFAGCTNLESIDLTKFNEVSPIMFLNCNSLKTIKNFTGDTIYYMGLSNCNNLESINLSNVTKLDSGCFNNCSKLNLKQNGLDFTKIQEFKGKGCSNTFNGCIGIGDVNLSSLTYTAYENGKHVCHICLAFKNCPDLTSITGNSNFDRISACDNVWAGSIENCPMLRKIDFSMCTKVTYVERHVCRNCNNLEIIKLPSSLEAIYYEFCGWDNMVQNLKAIYLPVVEPPVVYNYNGAYDSSNTNNTSTFNFSMYRNDIKIYVPDNSVESYKGHSQWSGWGDKIVPLSTWSTDYPND